MPIEMALWRLDDDQPVPVASSSLDKEKRLEEVLEKDIDILGLDRLLIIGRQVPTSWGKFIDLLALDPQGDLYVIELKRDRTPRDVVAQALDYGSWVKDLDYDALAEIYATYKQEGDFEEALKESFGETVPEEAEREPSADHRCFRAGPEYRADRRLSDRFRDSDQRRLLSIYQGRRERVSGAQLALQSG